MADFASMSLRSIAATLGGEISGNQVLCPGPNHSPKDRSLSIRLDSSASDGFVVHSFAGDDAIVCKDYVRERCGAEPFRPDSNARKRAVPPTSKVSDAKRAAAKARLKEALAAHDARKGPDRKIIATYSYTDEHGVLLYEVLRYEPKGFSQRNADGRPNLDGVRRVLYRLPDLIAYDSATIFICEGEKDVDRLVTLRLCATTISGGTDWTADVIEPLRGRDVIIVPDHDAPGATKAWKAASALHDVVASVRVVQLPDLSGRKDDKDVSDWLDADASRADTFVDICLATPLWTPQPAPPEAHEETPTGEDELLGEWDAADDDQPIPPRGWLLGNSFCRGFASSLLGDGGVGKTALRYLQMLALAIDRTLTGEHVFQRCRVLIVSLEDGQDELRRRLTAACLHHGIDRSNLKGWLYLAAIGRTGGKLMVLDEHGRPVVSTLAAKLARTIVARKIDIVLLDPFIKLHAIGENDNRGIDEVAQILTDMADKFNMAVDVPHHMSKGAADPGNPNRGRGASSLKDALRLVRTGTRMTPEEAQSFGVSEAERRRLFRVDDAKLNIAPMMEAKWFRLVGVNIGNASNLYPAGDNVQTVEVWKPPDLFGDIGVPVLNAILDVIETGLSDGNRYSDTKNVADDRAAWQVVKKHCGKDKGPAKRIIKIWVESGLLFHKNYTNPVTRKDVAGLWVDNLKRPS
jgi:hypothetical protein